MDSPTCCSTQRFSQLASADKIDETKISFFLNINYAGKFFGFYSKFELGNSEFRNFLESLGWISKRSLFVLLVERKRASWRLSAGLFVSIHIDAFRFQFKWNFYYGKPPTGGYRFQSEIQTSKASAGIGSLRCRLPVVWKHKISQCERKSLPNSACQFMRIQIQFDSKSDSFW